MLGHGTILQFGIVLVVSARIASANEFQEARSTGAVIYMFRPAML
jgi:hypothetical protein